MNFAYQLQRRFPSRIERPADVGDIPSGVFLVYMLAVDGHPVVIGSGKKNRAQIIFDSKHAITRDHAKAMTVRLYVLFGRDDILFERYLIRCASKEEAKEIEHALHRDFGGNIRNVPEDIYQKLFRGFAEDSLVRMVLQMALCSGFDGISDLKRWRRRGILRDEIWREISDRLMLPEE